MQLKQITIQLSNVMMDACAKWNDEEVRGVERIEELLASRVQTTRKGDKRDVNYV